MEDGSISLIIPTVLINAVLAHRQVRERASFAAFTSLCQTLGQRGIALVGGLSALFHSGHLPAPAAEITLTVGREDHADSAWAVVSIRDHGLGIPAADLPHIFDQFHRAGNVGGISGSGIGLTSARDVVEQHGGRIEVDSEEANGSIFTLRLSLEPDPRKST